jgi:NitT/TauT family transport system substrate-binding protein
MKKLHLFFLACVLAVCATAASAAEKVNVSLFSWPGYGFWFIAKEKHLVPGLDLHISIIEDPYQSFSLMAAGKLDVTSSTVEYGPIAADKKVPVKLVTYTNPSYGTDKIILAPGIKSAAQLKGKTLAVLEGGLTQIYMGMWLEQHGVSIHDVKFSNLIMDDAVGAMVGGTVAAGEYWEPFATHLLEALPKATVASTSADGDWAKKALLADGMYMSTAFADKRPKVAAMVMKAYFDAVDYWKAHPAEANKIIAKGLHFPVSDVEKVLGKTGKIHKGGIVVFDREEAARFMGLRPGPLPLGIKNDQIVQNWKTLTKWWLKFGLVKAAHPMESGVDLAPLRDMLASESKS